MEVRCHGHGHGLSVSECLFLFVTMSMSMCMATSRVSLYKSPVVRLKSEERGRSYIQVASGGE